MLFAGIDGGQSSTTAAIGGQDGLAIARGTAGPADEVDQSPSSSRLNDALGAALADALRNANLDPATRFTHVLAGISGYEGQVCGKAIVLPAQRVSLMHDAPIAHAGAFDRAPGIIIIAGTGSAVYGVNQSGRSLRLGGWGYLFGDEGSAFRLAREALSASMACEDLNEPSELAALALSYFKLPSLRAVVRSVYQQQITRERIAGFAPAILEAARCGDVQANALAVASARALARLATAASTRLEMRPPRIALAGGMFASQSYQQFTAAGLREMCPQTEIVEAAHDPAEGALRLAVRG